VSDQLPPPTGAPVEPATPTGGTPKAIVWAFVLSLAGFLIVTAVAAVVMVLANWKRVKASGKGKGLAIAALVISGLWLALMVFAAFLPSDEPTETAAPEVAEIIEESPEPDNAVQRESCLAAWKAENQAAQSGTLDDATLRATAYDCPDYETWMFMRNEVGYGNASPNLIVALCAGDEAGSPVCEDARLVGVLSP